MPDKNAAAHRVISNGKLLKDLGYDVVFFGITKENQTNNSYCSQTVFDFQCFSRNYPTSINQWISYFINNSDYEKIIKNYENVKAVICYNMPSLPLYRLKLFCNKRNIKIISDCTEWYKGSIKGNIFIGLIKRIDSILRMHFIQMKLDGIIAVSEFLNMFYSKKGLKTVKVPPLVDYKDQKWKTSFKQSNNVIEIVYAGGAFSLKDAYVKDRLDLVVQALSYLKSIGYIFCFYVVGCTLDDFIVFYPDLIKDINLLKNDIMFLGRVTHEEAIGLVKRADYSIFLRDESIVTKAGFPTKFVESITSGTPVLTNKNSNVVDYLHQGINGFLIDTYSIETIINTMITPLSQSQLKLKQMKKNTYESHIFDYRNFKEQFEILLG
ncbi:MAG: glycosyltransferase [Deltaproteobacteria bacterium]|nr:glycosyltransferase [Deltaproteobacteria bacterium]